ncbi:sensor histidine kinase [Nocardiopsis sp. HNM0947]|uniref:Sensor histidine kinase n=1 Tax=Nocardiopsis coralli TaxID=2772213 RepID=A0ABR9PBR6_9ACTN|nr:histidine kinase [Nocardiopsis coralli]MBE3001285.1 sensor histidine kinase [Nocardiopsis coralli]
MASELTDEAQGRLRRLSLEIVSASVTAIGVLLIVSQAQGWPDTVLMGAGLAATLLVVSFWGRGRFTTVALPGLVLTAAVWAAGALAFETTAAAFGFAVVATLVVSESAERRRALCAGLAAVVVAVLVLKPVLSAESLPTSALYVFATVCVAVAGIAMAILAQGVQELITELDRARRHEAEVAVMRERVRFAGDLHDIQGHTLHVVKLKVALARKLLHSDLARVEHELDEVHTLVGDTITETKELAHAQRSLNLAAELENAKNLLEAAGIAVHVERGAEPAPGTDALLGQVLRETTTNILRHSDAAQVWVTLDGGALTVANDGARGEGPPHLSGLAGLRDRLAAHGGELAVEQDGTRFRTAASLPHPDTAPDTRKDER